MFPKLSRPILILSVGIWFCAIAAGMWILWNYQNTPGASAAAPNKLPADTKIERSDKLPTLVMFVHPHCPCSRSSIGELALIMAKCQGRIAARVVFIKPKDFPTDWEKTDLWESAASIPGVEVSVDKDGVEAERFQSKTSGQVFLYSADGKLLFNGGITGARGHSGDNNGRSAIVSILLNGNANQTDSPVFGCPLQNKSEECHQLSNEEQGK